MFNVYILENREIYNVRIIYYDVNLCLFLKYFLIWIIRGYLDFFIF